VQESFYFNEQHVAVRDMVREFARERVAPIAAAADASQDFPWETVAAMGELGLLGIP